MVSVDWKWSPLFVVESVVFCTFFTSARSVIEELSVWSSRTVSWINLTVLLLGDVMLIILESVIAGPDDSVVDHWWLRVDLLAGKLVSSGCLSWEIVWQGLVW